MLQSTVQSSLKVLILGNPWFFRDHGRSDIKTFTVRLMNESADLSLPHAIYHAPTLLSLVREAGFDPDIIFHGDESLPPWLYGLESLNIPLIWYAIDSHIHMNWHIHYASAFDHIFLSQNKYHEEFVRYLHPDSLTFMPLYAPPDPVSYSVERTMDAIFVGNLDPGIHPERSKFFKELSKIVKIELITGPYKKLFSDAKIILNHSSHDEVNFRVFEALYCGGLLITDRAQGLENIFSDKKHLVLFEPWNVTEAAGMIKYYLDNENERRHIAWNGFRNVIGNHLRTDRLNQVITHLFLPELNRRKDKRLYKLELVKQRVRNAYEPFAQDSRLNEKTRDIYTDLWKGNLK